MTKEEVEQAFNGVSPYYAYKQGVQDGIAYNEESFRREAAKDILQSIIVTASQVYEMESLDKSIWCEQAIEWADTLIAKLKEK